MLFLSSCGRHVIRDSLYDFYSRDAHRDSTLLLDFHKLLHLDYEEYFLFHGLVFSKEIAIGTNHPYHGFALGDDEFRFIFFDKKGRVVYEETLRDYNNRGITYNYTGNYTEPWKDGFTPSPQLCAKYRNERIVIDTYP